MDIARHQARINQLVREMLVEGLLNGQFQLVQTIRAAGDCQLVAKMILVYCTLIGKNIRAIANYLTKPNVNYAGAAVHAGHLGIRSCSIGAQSILHACCLFVQACAYGSKERCVNLLYRLYRQYSHLHTKFMEVLQLEVQIFLHTRQS
ncbi:histidine-containing phosphotransfer protein 1 isoform X1 [Vitis vinifera]|uniref:histidine-containing phosphotransfer protein 1 isoform X1 n=1 Tax=Vitis vinifera TaxID=29760 RepID=UPI00288302C3|nr:histidine-containing phosphotransfer protein 1 isoform X1 [Vitis vinifera]XP_059591448.1 histidine-containing phosphotransfer protein 1 isoform X1 [Vitis vinifera]